MKGKHEKKKVQIFELYSVLLLVATLVMSMAYAEMSGTMMSVSTNTEVEAQTGVFITEVTTSDEVNAIVNNYIATVMDSSITLASSGDTKTFNIKIYNSTNKPQVFIDIIKLDETYDNAKIACTLSENIVPKTTILEPKSFITFSVTLRYTESDTPTGELRSMLNFRFQEVPTIKITPNGAIENIYPDYTPSEYTFIVENANESATNGVPLTYKLSANISAPFIAKIYNESGTEVKSTDEISLAGDGSNVTHTYKLKILWDNSNPENGKEYNSSEYANKSYNCKINLTATPTDENNKYLGYQLTKEESINVTTAPLYFNTSIDKQTVEMNNNKAEAILTVNNNNGTNYNIFETQYKISIDNNKFTLKIDGSEIGDTTISLGNTATISQNHEVELIPITGKEFASSETCNILVQAVSPYSKTETVVLTITDTVGPTAPEITGGSANFATSQTISVSKVATDTGTGVGKYQYLVNADGTTSAVATADVGSTSTETSKTFNTDYNGYYVYFRAVDAVGNVGEWSNAQTLNIDTQPPIVSLVEEGEATIEEGTSYAVADYFTYSANGNAGIKSVTYTVDGQNIENTSGLAEGTHTIICTVTKNTNLSASASKTVVVNSSVQYTAADVAVDTNFYGASITNYTTPAGDPNVGWKIFHSDGDNIYLIADDYINNSYLPTSRAGNSLNKSGSYKAYFTNILNDYTGSADILNTNITDSRVVKWISWASKYSSSIIKGVKSVAYMLDTVRWNGSYRNNSYADYAIGGPTLELFVASYNLKHPSLNLGYSTEEDLGYRVGSGGYYYDFDVGGLDSGDALYISETSGTNASAYWLAAPSPGNDADGDCLLGVTWNGWLEFLSCNEAYGFRPLVCLKSGVTLKPAGSGQYELVEPPITAADVAADTSFYGASITNYTTPAGDPNVGWKIFHSDGNHIFLIADDVVQPEYVPKGKNGTSGDDSLYNTLPQYVDYTGASDILNEKLTNPEVLAYYRYATEYPTATHKTVRTCAFLLDTSAWSIYSNDALSDWCIGGPTLELYAPAFNAVNQTTILKYKIYNKGYSFVDSGYNSESFFYDRR